VRGLLNAEHAEVLAKAAKESASALLRANLRGLCAETVGLSRVAAPPRCNTLTRLRAKTEKSSGSIRRHSPSNPETPLTRPTDTLPIRWGENAPNELAPCAPEPAQPSVSGTALPACLPGQARCLSHYRVHGEPPFFFKACIGTMNLIEGSATSVAARSVTA
jgi:hypothetical protein